MYYAIFATRRFDLVLISIVLAEDSPLNDLARSHYDKKIFLFLYLQILYLAYVHTVWPHSESLFNYLEVFNEYVLTSLGYFMIIFCSSRNIVDLKTEKQLENIVIYLIWALGIVNVGIMLKICLLKLIHFIKKRKIDKLKKQ